MLQPVFLGKMTHSRQLTFTFSISAVMSVTEPHLKSMWLKSTKNLYITSIGYSVQYQTSLSSIFCHFFSRTSTK